MSQHEPLIFDVRSGAVALCMTEKALRARITRGQIPFKRLGGKRGRLVIARADLERFIARLPPAVDVNTNTRAYADPR